jgi:hypothetical protein
VIATRAARRGGSGTLPAGVPGQAFADLLALSRRWQRSVLPQDDRVHDAPHHPDCVPAIREQLLIRQVAKHDNVVVGPYAIDAGTNLV